MVAKLAPVDGVAAAPARARRRRARRDPGFVRSPSMLLATLILFAWQGGSAQEAGIDPAGTPRGFGPRLTDPADMNAQENLDFIRTRVDAADAERAAAIVLAAATMPGRREADPPTGPIAAAPSRQDADPRSGPGSGASNGTNGNGRGLNGNGNGNGNGFKLRFAPIQWSGNLSLDGRWSRDGEGLHSRQLLVNTDLDGATYLWQPWFAQMRAGIGALVARGNTNDLNGAGRGDSVVAYTGRVGLAVFPASRFPFELRGDVSDSRSGGDYLGTDYRSKRLSVSQSYRPAQGSDSYNLTYDYSALSSSRLPDDTVSTLRGLMVSVSGDQSFELSGSHSLNERGGSADDTRVTTLTGRHGYRGGAAFTIDNLATYNDLRVRSEAAALDYATSIKQFSSFASYRPQKGDALYSEAHPLYLIGSARLIESDTSNGGASAQARATNATLGANADLSRHWRLGAAVAASTIDQSTSDTVTLTSEALTLNYAPDPVALGEWRYSPQAATSGTFTQGGIEGSRSVLGAQFGHGLSRSYLPSDEQAVSVNLSQTVGANRDSSVDEWSRTLSHSASLFWRISGDTASQAQTFAGLSASDSRSYGGTRGTFDIVNLQVSRRTQLSRSSSWSGSVTAQATRSRFAATTASTTPATVTDVTPDTGWRHFYSAGLTYTETRVFSVPRLRFSLLATANSEQTERRALGDADAPREYISHSVEARFEHTIGRLDSRLTFRTARVDGRRQDVAYFRINRSFGGY